MEKFLKSWKFFEFSNLLNSWNFLKYLNLNLFKILKIFQIVKFVRICC